MNKRLIPLLVCVVTLAACQPAIVTPAATLPVLTEVPTVSATIAPTQEAIVQLSFSATRFENAEGQFAFDYPDTWIVDSEQVIGDRGSQQVLLSPGTTLETLAEGGARIVIHRYSWDPRNDLAAWVTTRKTAWDASGFVILEESTRELEDGRAVVDLLMETPDRQPVIYALTTIGERYLEIIFEGDTVLGKEILSTLVSIQK